MLLCHAEAIMDTVHVLGAILVCLVLAAAVEFYRVKSLEKSAGMPQPLSIQNVFVVAAVLLGVGLTAYMLLRKGGADCGRAGIQVTSRSQDPLLFVSRDRPAF